ncbi:LysE family translocator [Pseudomonas sp. dw_358]|uniref:LysE family translocator n=1 Tax=Pseudomonas sp. dw_358 TaxID=2720083 RepID=UPI001BD6C97B|nr:LysE family translocator [Pseudomonas sp. dw_358]
MALHHWVMFFLTYLATTLSPGPNILLSVRNTLRFGPGAMVATLAGNLTAQLLLATAVTLGVGAILKEVPAAFMAVKVVGAGALIYLGIRQLLTRPAVPVVMGEAMVCLAASRWQLAAQAFLVSASNPNTLLFLCVFLPQFIVQGQPLLKPFALMVATMAMTVVMVHAAYCLMAYHFSRRFKAAHWVAMLKRSCGLIFIGVGMHLLDARIL